MGKLEDPGIHWRRLGVVGDDLGQRA